MIAKNKIIMMIFGLNAMLTHADYGYIKLELHRDRNLTTIAMSVESPIANAITVKQMGTDAIRTVLFPNVANRSTQPGIIFDYKTNSIQTYNTHIQAISDPAKRVAVRQAFTAFQNYITNNIEQVVKIPGNFDAEVNSAIKNPITAANRAMYYEIRKVGSTMGVYLPDIDAVLFGSPLLGSAWKAGKKALPWVLVAGGLFLTYKLWNQIPTVGDVGLTFQRTGQSMTECDTAVRSWWNTPRTSPAPQTPLAPEVPATIETPNVTPIAPPSVPSNTTAAIVTDTPTVSVSLPATGTMPYASATVPDISAPVAPLSSAATIASPATIKVEPVLLLGP